MIDFLLDNSVVLIAGVYFVGQLTYTIYNMYFCFYSNENATEALTYILQRRKYRKFEGICETLPNFRGFDKN